MGIYTFCRSWFSDSIIFVRNLDLLSLQLTLLLVPVVAFVAVVVVDAVAEICNNNLHNQY